MASHDPSDEDLSPSVSRESSNVPPVRASPRHPEPPDGDSGVRQLSAREAKILMHAWAEEAAASAKETATKLIDRNLIIAGVAAVTVTFGVFFTMEARAQKYTDGGVTNVAKDLAEHKTSTNEKFQQLNAAQQRTEVKVDALLLRFGVPNPAPAPKVVPTPDGGSP